MVSFRLCIVFFLLVATFMLLPPACPPVPVTAPRGRASTCNGYGNSLPMAVGAHTRGASSGFHRPPEINRLRCSLPGPP